MWCLVDKFKNWHWCIIWDSWLKMTENSDKREGWKQKTKLALRGLIWFLFFFQTIYLILILLCVLDFIFVFLFICCLGEAAGPIREKALPPASKMSEGTSPHFSCILFIRINKVFSFVFMCWKGKRGGDVLKRKTSSIPWKVKCSHSVVSVQLFAIP